MSTRATYRIFEKNGDEAIVSYFYIHYDGYPEGALDYFKQLLEFREWMKVRYEELGDSVLRDIHRKTWSALFEIGIPLSQRTIDHEYHGDTEYRYSLYFNKDTLEHVEFTGDHDNRKFDGPYTLFEKIYSKREGGN